MYLTSKQKGILTSETKFTAIKQQQKTINLPKRDSTIFSIAPSFSNQNNMGFQNHLALKALRI